MQFIKLCENFYSVKCCIFLHVISSLTSAGLCRVPAVFQPCGEHTPGRAAHALLQGILNMPRDSTLKLHLHRPLGFPNAQPLILNSNAAVSLIFKFYINVFQVSEDVPVSSSFRGKGYALKVAYHNSVELVLAAAREYFNSSTTLKDSCMGLAR